ncbi:MAG TPA: 3-hydroxyacyl-CoA dehydrogenase NAD-binding domain-containing protein, partial [Acetobacteraceae bacterium]|nr:3-hydroxyacyl-CoA dehydrogenase NAD-binding domain-containing protein [Acetobacteraceae bacterium]
MTEAAPVNLTRDGDVGVITVDFPPVNALGPGVPEGIVAAIRQANADPAIGAIVLIGAGRSFIAGADIRQFGKPRNQLPLGQRVYDILDASEKPVVAAIHGYALGGGLEIAMACHYRLAVPSAKVGLPEVLIGILPGGGGTQRLPRLAGPKVALEMITSGRHVPAPEAARLGIIDQLLADGADLRSEAVAYARRIAARRPLPRVRDRDDRLKEARDDPGIFDATRRAIARRARNQKAPYNCIAAVEAACNLPIDDGLKRERDLFAELENSDEARALRYAFFAEREVAKLPDLPDDVKPLDFATVAVIGAGTMGGGIAMGFADFGIPVRIMDTSREALERGLERIHTNYATSVRRGSLTEDESERRFARIHPVSDYAEIADCDLAVEAVFEEMEVKKPVFARLDQVMKPGALLFSNTSALDIDQLAAVTSRPQDVAGTHFFSPANVMKLLEVVRGTKSSPRTLRTAMQMGRRIGKISAMAGNTDGFVANRSRAPFSTETVILLEEGCLPEQVDKVMVDFGYPMGPFAVGDLAGLDVGAAGRRRRAAANPEYR